MTATLQSAMEMHRQGQLAQAGTLYQQILLQDPKNLDALSMLSILHEQNGDLRKAIEVARQLIHIKPKQIEYMLHLANLLLSQSETAQALEWLEKAAKLDRRNLDVQLALGDTYQQKREYETAVKHYHKALQLDRSVPDVYNNLGNTYLAMGKLEDAIQQYQKAISLKKDYVQSYYNLGNAQRQFGNLAEAITAYQKAIELDPYFYQAYSMLGLTAKNMSNYDHAEAFYRQALTIKPNDPSTLSNLAIVLAEQDRIDEAMQVFTELAQKYPDHPDVLSDFALTIHEKGFRDRALVIYEALAQRNPDNPNQQINHSLALPVIYNDSDHLIQWRKRYEQGLDSLLQKQLDPLRPHKVGAFSGASFYLAYQGLNDKAFQCKMSQIYQKILPTPPQMTANRKANTKSRIGFISGHLSPKHTIGKLMYGILANLCRDKFEIHIFSTPTKHAFSANLKIHPDDQVHLLPYPSLIQSWEAIHASNLDIIFYSDIGMDPFSYILANYRLAPVQCVTWGHPVTTGIPTIDYFISSKWIEPENAQDHYSEALVLLDSLPSYYYQPKLSGDYGPRHEFGWSPSDHIYLCPQSLYKFHPDFDPILADLLRQDPQGKLVLLDRGQEPISTQLKARFQKNMPDVAERIEFLPSVSRERFLQLLTCGDVMLDPVHFGGGNTTYEALGLGVPIVTWPSEYMRGRVTAGCYRQMGLDDLVADSAETYVQLAVKLGTDAEYKMQTRERILAQNHRLFEDQRVIEELEAFFLKALDETGAPTHD